MPHTITVQSDVKSHGIRFSKALCMSNSNNFKFEPVAYESEFDAFNGQGFGVVKAQSLCFYCVTNEAFKPPKEHTYWINILTSRVKVSNRDCDWIREVLDVRITHDLPSCHSVSL